MTSQRRNPQLPLFIAIAFGTVSVIGFASWLYLWGKLEYGVVGYVVIWGPFVTLFFSFLFARDYLASKQRTKHGSLDSQAMRL